MQILLFISMFIHFYRIYVRVSAESQLGHNRLWRHKRKVVPSRMWMAQVYSWDEEGQKHPARCEWPLPPWACAARLHLSEFSCSQDKFEGNDPSLMFPKMLSLVFTFCITLFILFTETVIILQSLQLVSINVIPRRNAGPVRTKIVSPA